MEGLLVNVYVEGFKWERATIEDVKTDSIVICNEEGRRLEIGWDAIVNMSWCQGCGMTNFEMPVPVNDRSIKAGQAIGSCIRTKKGFATAITKPKGNILNIEMSQKPQLF